MHYEEVPLPSWADVAFLSVYPFILLGILLLPAQPLRLTTRLRVVLDGLMIMTAMITFSWYFVLGPTLLQATDTILAQIVGSAYPVMDVVLVFCLLLLTVQLNEPALRRVVRLLQIALGVVVITDSVYQYQQLHGTYHTGGIVDVGWPLGYMLIGLAAHRFRLNQREQPAALGSSATPVNAATPSWEGLALLPYAFVPAVGGLVLYAWRSNGAPFLQVGIYVGGGVLIALVLLRQIIALLDNQRLSAQLNANNAALTEANTRLQALATTDALTELPNHRATNGTLDHELERARRFGRSCAVLFLDLDHFKALNDSYGHVAGDATLLEMARVVRAALRGVDALGRWGGEELVAVLPEADSAIALAVAERIRTAVAAHTFAAGGGAHLTCSLGVAVYPIHGEERDGLLAEADRAMYAAKHLGRNQVRSAGDAVVKALAMEVQDGGSREEAALTGTVEALAALVEARDQYTGQHTEDVAALTLRLALALGLGATEARMVALAGRLHDVGKIAVPDAVLQKRGQLTEDEWVQLRTHPQVGADVVSRVPALRALAPVIRAHHERWDGRGYPQGLAGETIPLAARIVAAADCYHAITSNRPYREAQSATWALDELQRCAGTQFDPDVIAALQRVVCADGTGRVAAAG